MSAGIKSQIQRLEAYNNSPLPILSVYYYLHAPQNKTNGHLLSNLQKLLRKNLTSYQQIELKNNMQYIEGYLQNYKLKPQDKTLAFFSSGDTLFEIVHSPEIMESKVVVAHDPYLDPLLQADESERRFLVILTDRAKAIFYTLYLGVIEDQRTYINRSVPQDVKGRWPEVPHAQRDDKVQRHIQNHIHQHYTTIARHAKDFVKDRTITGVILGGHKNEMNQFEKHLPKDLKDKVSGKFVSELKGNFNEILERSKQTVASVNYELNHTSRDMTA